MNFTPGPWEPRKRYYADFDLPHWEVAYGDMEAHRLVAGYVRTEADARLIAAAPELVDKFREALGIITTQTPQHKINEFLKGAAELLRRIEGEEDHND